MSNYEFCRKCLILEDAIKECLRELLIMRRNRKMKWSIVNKVYNLLALTQK